MAQKISFLKEESIPNIPTKDEILKYYDDEDRSNAPGPGFNYKGPDLTKQYLLKEFLYF